MFITKYHTGHLLENECLSNNFKRYLKIPENTQVYLSRGWPDAKTFLGFEISMGICVKMFLVDFCHF